MLGSKFHWFPVVWNGLQPKKVDIHVPLRTAIDMRGSAGADMWRGDELACFSLDVWTLFERLTNRWLQVGDLPAALLDARMVLLPKEDKVVDGRVSPDQCRPITILSAFWRVWMSSWLKKCTSRAWLDEVLDPSIQYGGACDAAVASAAVLEIAGAACRARFSKCYYFPSLKGWDTWIIPQCKDPGSYWVWSGWLLDLGVNPKIGGKPPKWMVYNGKPY